MNSVKTERVNGRQLPTLGVAQRKGASFIKDESLDDYLAKK
jgi:hypothetical protein